MSEPTTNGGSETAPAAPPDQLPGPLDGAIQETAQAIRQTETEEAYLKQSLEQVRSRLDRLRGRLDTLVEVSHAIVVVPSNGAPPPEAPRPERGRPRQRK